MRKKRVDRPRLDEMIARSRAGETFLVPAQICTPVLREAYGHSHALRVFFGLLWISSEVVRSGAVVCFRASLAEIRVAAGFEGYAKDTPVLDALPLLGGEVCHLEDGAEVKVFERLEVIDLENRVIEWIFTEEFIEMFVSPRVFAIVSISEMINLKSGLDFFLYLQVRRIWKMQKKAVRLNVPDLCRAAGFEDGIPFQRVAERVRRTASRLEVMLDSTILLRSVRQPGDRRHTEMQLEVKGA